MASLSLTRPDKFHFYNLNGNLNESTEGVFWLAANTVLGLRWQMKKPFSSPSTNGDSKGPRKVAFHRAPGATVQSGSSGTFIRQAGNCSGDCQAIIDVTAEVHRSSSIYVTTGLPRSTPPSNEIYDYAIQSLIDVLRVLVTQDSSNLI